MKVAEREQARCLRQAGLSVKEIEKQLGVARSSVSVWVRDIILTDAQIKHLEDNENYTRAQRIGSETNRKQALEIRQHYQALGRKKAREGDLLHQAGCMLYWAEGSKERTSVRFCNSDVNMVNFFLRFMTKALQIDRKDIKVNIHCYTDCHSVVEIEHYWLSQLCLPKPCLGTTNILKHTTASKRERKLPYGVCRLSVHSVKHIQHIYGAIQEYSRLDNPEWIK
jgi:hypothetical protein